jgi:hypothetical protein
VAFAVSSTVLHGLLRARRRPLRVVAVLPAAVYLSVGAGDFGPAERAAGKRSRGDRAGDRSEVIRAGIPGWSPC